MNYINLENTITVTKDSLSIIQIEALQKLKEAFNLDASRKAFLELSGNCLDNDKFNPERHIDKIKNIEQSKRLDKEFFDTIKKEIKN